MDYNLLLQNLKDEHYQELKDIKVKLKPLRILRKAFMITLPFSTNIFYNKNILRKCNEKALKAVLMHELYHLTQFKRLNFFQKLIFVPRYHIKEQFRINHEIENHIEVVKKGFGLELLELNKFVKSRYPKEIWESKLSHYYLPDEEIKNLM